MLKELLWLYDAKRQYEHQKAQGLAGLVAILSVIFFVWKWEEWFYPIFKNIGLVDIVENTGLVSDLSVMTVINVMALIFILCLAYALFAFAAVLLGMIFLIFISSKVGETIITFALMPIIGPFLWLKVRQMKKDTLSGTFNEDHALKPLLKQYLHLNELDKHLQLYLHQLEKEDKTFKMEKWNYLSNSDKTIPYLNRAIPSVKDDVNWLIGYQPNEQKLYIFFPNPLPIMCSRSFDKNFDGEGLFGFKTQHYATLGRHINNQLPYYFPAIQVDIKWQEQSLKLVVESSMVEAKDIHEPFEYYRVKGEMIDSVFKQIIKSRNDISDTLNMAHVAYYLLPIAYEKNKNINSTEESNLFFAQCKQVINGDVFYPIYASDVQKEIINHAKLEEEWAINWFKEVE